MIKHLKENKNQAIISNWSARSRYEEEGIEVSEHCLGGRIDPGYRLI